MGGVMGAVSGKFVVMAATMLLQVRVNQTRVDAILDPALPTSIMSQRLAAQLHIVTQSSGPQQIAHPVTIGVGAEEFKQSGLGVGTVAGSQADLVLGQDILTQHVLAIDFRTKNARLILPYELHKLTANYRQISLVRATDGWHLSVTVDGQPAIDARLDLSSVTPIAVDEDRVPDQSYLSSDGPVSLQSEGVVIGSFPISHCLTAAQMGPVSIGLGAFMTDQIILDLLHQSIWIRK